MPKGQPRARVNPIVKLQTQITQIQSTVESLLKAATAPDFSTQAASVIASIKAKQTSSSKISPEIKKVVTFLQTYPGMVPMTKLFLNQRKAEYSQLGVLDKYKTAPEKKPRQTKAAKKA